MAGAASISGLASGLDTATIIEQLMSLEAVSQNRLKTRVTTEQRAVSSMQTLNALVSSLASRAGDLLKPGAWTPLKVTSGNAGVTVTTTSGAAPGAFSVRVDRTALSHRLEHATATGLTTADAVPTTVRLDRLDGTAPLDLTTDGTLQGLVTALNDPANATGVRATAVRVGTDSYRLMVESTTTGAATDFTLTDAADGSAVLGGAVVRAGQDAQVTLGDSIVATSATNTFTDLVPGATLTLAAGATGTAEISMTRDDTAVQAAVKGLVDAVNGVLTEIDTLTKTDPTAGTKGALAGDAGIRSLRGQLLQTVFPGDDTSLADLGVQTDRSGKLVFDATAFKDAYLADPEGTAARLSAAETGFAARVKEMADTASNKTDGTITTAITSRNDAIKRLNADVDAWDIRLELRRTALTRQFTALETALSQMNSQSSWLAGQISGLTAGQGS
jgi:flagellar hook-associated protein 2